MPTGRPPTPLAIRRRRGNPQKRPMPPETGTAAVELLPDPPKSLTKHGREAWLVVGGALADAGILQAAHLPQLESFAMAIELRAKAWADLQRGGFLRAGKRAQVIAPQFRVWRDATSMAVQIAETLGASATAMARLGIATFKGRTLQQELAEKYGLELSGGPSPR